MEFERKNYHYGHLNIAPLVDVVFLLIIFFMLTAHFAQEPAIKIRLPLSKTAQVEDAAVKTIHITRDGDIFLMDKKIDLKNLREGIRSTVTAPEKDVFRIKADREASVGLMISVMDEVRLSGVKTFSIGTDLKK